VRRLRYLRLRISSRSARGGCLGASGAVQLNLDSSLRIYGSAGTMEWGESLADMKTLDRWRDSVGLAYGDRERRQPSLGEPAQPTASKSPMRP
jgi:hypothetical protein